MKTFEEFIIEDVGDKFAAMDDAQFDDWKKNNAGAAKKAEDLRNKARNKNNQEKKAKPNTPGGPLNLRQNPKERTSQSRTSDWAKKQSTKTTSSSDEDDFNMDDIFNDAEQRKMVNNMTKDDHNAQNSQTRRLKREKDRQKKLDKIKYERGQKLKKATAKVGDAVKGFVSAVNRGGKYSKTGVESTGMPGHGRSGQPKSY